ncbi:MAG: SpoIIE family protein phosphatase [bacterium]|nr:SpoIIE family protein phosphatase [bacterium]
MLSEAATTTQIEDLEARLEYRKAQLRDLATMGAVITSIHETGAVLSVVMDMAMGLVGGEVGLIMLTESGKVTNKVCWGVSEEFVKALMYQDGKDLATYCLEHRETVVLADLGIKSEEGITLNTVVALPIQTSERCHGLIVMFNKTDGGNFSADDQEVLEMLLRFVAVAIDNTLLMKERLQRQKIQQEIAIAKQVQETILPQQLDETPGVDIGAIYFPARDVSGDFYDVIKISEQTFYVVIGDVSNKGVPAALVMSACSGIIKTVVENEPTISVSQLARRVNELMGQGIIKDREMFVTLFFCKFDLAGMRLSFCNAGHLPGLYWNDETQTIDSLAAGGPIIGQFPGIRFIEEDRPLHRNDRLFLFTDGLTEAEDADGHLFGRERAEQVLTSEIDLPPKQFCLKVKEWVDRFSEGTTEDSHDDFTLLQVKVN